MSDGESFQDLKKQVDSIVGSDAKRLYLEKYIRENTNIPLPLLAQIYEKLGKLHLAEKRERPWYFVKAAGIWEMDAILNEVKGKYEKHFRRVSLRNSIRNYKRAYRIHLKNGEWSEMNEIKNKQRIVERELRLSGGPAKTVSIFAVIAMFAFSFMFLSSWPTGFAVLDPVDYGQSTGAGIAFVILGIVGGVFVLWRWYRR
jgi:hypothetical protein